MDNVNVVNVISGKNFYSYSYSYSYLFIYLFGCSLVGCLLVVFSLFYLVGWLVDCLFCSRFV